MKSISRRATWAVPLLLLGSAAAAAETASNGWDVLHARISRSIARPIEEIDRFFADESLDEENERTRLHVALGLRYGAEDGAALLSDFKLRLALPRLENRLQLFLDETIAADDPAESGNVSEAVEDSEPDAGVRFILKRDERKSLNTDFGMRFGDPSQLFGRLRGRLTVPLDPWELRLIQIVAWFSEDGWTESTEMRWSRPLANDYLFRSTSRLVWEEKSAGVNPVQTLALFKDLGAHSGYAWTATGRWPGTPDAQNASYAVAFAYRLLIYRNWLFMEVSPGVEFLQISGYEPDPFIGCRFEVVFNDE